MKFVTDAHVGEIAAGGRFAARVRRHRFGGRRGAATRSACSWTRTQREFTTPWNSFHSRISVAMVTTLVTELDILAAGKRVVIIGGGDTGADCLGTTHRQKPISVHQFEIMPMPPEQRSPQTPWPLWPMQLRIEGAHEEGGIRGWSIATSKFTGDEARKCKAASRCSSWPSAKVRTHRGKRVHYGCRPRAIGDGLPGSGAQGHDRAVKVALDARGNVATDADYMTSVPGIFAAGDMRRGQSLVVWAISEGRKAAVGVDKYLCELAKTETIPATISSANLFRSRVSQPA